MAEIVHEKELDSFSDPHEILVGGFVNIDVSGLHFGADCCLQVGACMGVPKHVLGDPVFAAKKDIC